MQFACRFPWIVPSGLLAPMCHGPTLGGGTETRGEGDGLQGLARETEDI